MRRQFRETLLSLAGHDPRIVLILGDVSVYLFDTFKERYGDRFYNMGICENTLVSTAAGLAGVGFKPVVHTIAPFITERSLEQIKIDMCYNGFGGNIVSCGASFDYAWDGATHHCYTDLAILRLIPGMEVVQPGSKKELDLLLRSQYGNDKATYFRLSDHPHTVDMHVRFGKGVVLKNGSSGVTVITGGPLLENVLEACRDIDVNLLYFHTIKPIDRELIREYSHTKLIVIHDAFGLYEAVCETPGLSATYHGLPDRVLRLVRDAARHSGGTGPRCSFDKRRGTPVRRGQMTGMHLDKAKILVTGGTGFIGRHMVEELQRAGSRVRVSVHERPLPEGIGDVETVRADLTRVEDCRVAVKGADYVIHAAGTAGAAGVRGALQLQGISLNVVLSTTLLQTASEEGVKKIVVFGSSTGYPSLAHPVAEDEMWSGEPHPSYFGYGWMRRYIEKLGEYVTRESTCDVVVVRPSAIYGPWDNFSDTTGHVIPALIRRAARREDPFVVWGSGSEVRDFLHVRDFARGTLLSLQAPGRFSCFNIGSGRPSTISEIVSLVLHAVGHDKASLVFDRTKPVTIPFRLLDIGKARLSLGFEPVIVLEQGIRETADWYLGRGVLQ